jgi:hypothetical protein
MSILHDVAQSRVLARYRLMFRASTMAFGAALFVIGVGLLTAIFASWPNLLGAGLLLGSLSGLSAYKIALSTMALIDVERGNPWREVV